MYIVFNIEIGAEIISGVKGSIKLSRCTQIPTDLPICKTRIIQRRKKVITVHKNKDNIPSVTVTEL